MRKVLFILGQLNDSDAEWLARFGQRQRVAAGMELIRHGTHIDTIYIVLEGSLSVLAANGMRLAEVGCGEILGEMSMVDSGLTTASVRSDQECVVLAVPKKVLQEKLNDDAPFAARFYRALSLFLADRMRNTIRRMGYGKDEPGTQVETDFDELDPDVLDRVHLAGARFERLLKRMAGG
jgi:CRP-like cAMP-binding protein